ncbi:MULTISPECIES: heavy metal-responsive transcriptional regulator [Ralstonia solanacearum species complex]|uniref:HTH merR-type domain-containing protein n=4 Tax=Ralstonia solanacearum TaxID=305 RepID=A0A7U7JEH1_RALSL|nr:heavy metal-responsive transcriptional regulator [Ralstonia solanacearum]ALF90576.1 Mercuric resistance operon regulatory protein [Ralstonia solanacearum]ATI30017.1 heavy metal-responsive transcriptional regulator [Ralstonia solanacearum]EAP73419.1 Transcriptional regulator, MerR family [Ralstonia solanacearum UW551]KEI32858.1 MerR family transcriptional regulator [Ralstonia solanacearum]KFX29340.1 MerR family transcriptional regulator [Ralstonia solanacearum]
MRIGELCKRAGVSRDTVRYYERMGLLDKATQPHSTNTYKRYSELSLQRIRLIIHAKALGFTLAEINDVIHVWDSPTFAVAQKVACLQAKLTELDEKSHALTMLRAGLLNAMAKVGSDCVEEQIAW